MSFDVLVSVSFTPATVYADEHLSVIKNQLIRRSLQTLQFQTATCYLKLFSFTKTFGVYCHFKNISLVKAFSSLLHAFSIFIVHCSAEIVSALNS